MKRTCDGHPLIGVKCSVDAVTVLYRHGKSQAICRAFDRYLWAIGHTTGCYACHGKQRINDCWVREDIR